VNASAEVVVVMLSSLAFGAIVGWRVRDLMADVDRERERPTRLDVIETPPLCPYCDQHLERRRHIPNEWSCVACHELTRIVGKPIDYSQTTNEQLLPRLHQVAKARRSS